MWRKKKDLKMIQGIRATSKSSLKLQCLYASKGNIKEAKELYDFFASDIESLPDHDPVKPSWLDNTKETVTGLVGWIKDNQDTLAQGYEFIRSVIQRKSLPTPPSAGEPLPPINQ